MTKFHTNDEELLATDPFDGTQFERRIVFTRTEEKYPKGRALAAAFWASYFTLHWLMLLDVVEFTTGRAGATIFFLVAAILVTMLVAAHDQEKKK